MHLTNLKTKQNVHFSQSFGNSVACAVFIDSQYERPSDCPFRIGECFSASFLSSSSFIHLSLHHHCLAFTTSSPGAKGKLLHVALSLALKPTCEWTELFKMTTTVSQTFSLVLSVFSCFCFFLSALFEQDFKNGRGQRRSYHHHHNQVYH